MDDLKRTELLCTLNCGLSDLGLMPLTEREIASLNNWLMTTQNTACVLYRMSGKQTLRLSVASAPADEAYIVTVKNLHGNREYRFMATATKMSSIMMIGSRELKTGAKHERRKAS